MEVRYCLSVFTNIPRNLFFVVTPYWSIKGLGEQSGESEKLEFEKDCGFDDIAGDYVLRRY